MSATRNRLVSLACIASDNEREEQKTTASRLLLFPVFAGLGASCTLFFGAHLVKVGDESVFCLFRGGVRLDSHEVIGCTLLFSAACAKWCALLLP